QVLSWNPGNLGLRTKLRTGNTSDLKPLLIQFHVLAEGISGAEQVRLGASTEDADGSGMTFLVVTEETAVDQVESSDFGVIGLDAVDNRRILLRLWNCFGWGETLARGSGSNIPDIVSDNAVVLKSESGRNAADLIVSLPLDGLLGLDDQITYPH